MRAGDKIKLYFHRSPNSYKVLLLLEEAAIPYDLIPIDVYAGDQHRLEYLKVNPNAKVPALRDGDTTVFDSNAMLLYLSQRAGGRFMPAASAEQGQMLSWLMFVASGLGPFSGQSVHFLRYAPEKLPYAINRYMREVERHYKVLDERLSQAEFLAGTSYSIADMAAWGWVNLIGSALDGVTTAAYPAVKVWHDRINARPAAQRVHVIGEQIKGKDVLDEEARALLFPQNLHLKQPA